jgi:Flp pilus assembly protein TadD
MVLPWDAGARNVPVGQSDLAENESPDPVQQKNNLLLARAALLEADQKTVEAIDAYQTILKTDPRHVPALRRLAILHAHQGQADAAEMHFLAAIQADSRNARLHNDYDYFCYLRNQPETAERHLTKAIELDTKLREAHNNLGFLKARSGRFDEARYHFECGGCTSAESLNNIAFARVLEQDLQGASTTYQLALDQQPDQVQARTGLAAVDRFIRSAPRQPELSGRVQMVAPASYLAP